MVFGTRPEAIKMAPVVQQCRQRTRDIDAIVCLTGQHREMLKQVVDYFQIQPQLNLDLMTPNQTLAELTAGCIKGIDAALERFQPHCLVVQGDTTSVMAAGMAAFYRHVPLVHVEAGLRTGNLQSPWPEELNRRIATLTTSLHFAPTQKAAENLLAEGISSDSIHVTGNTVVDALLWTVRQERTSGNTWTEKYPQIADRRLVLITGHRRENFGDGMAHICQAIATLADTFPDVGFLYPVHLNPNVRKPVHELLAGRPNVWLTEPVSYPEFVWLMDRCTLILSDSGGVQEEAPSLKKPVLVMRDTTERPEAVEAGAVRLVGTSPERIIHWVTDLLQDENLYRQHQVQKNPYGDGQAAERIVDLMLKQEWQR